MPSASAPIAIGCVQQQDPASKYGYVVFFKKILSCSKHVYIFVLAVMISYAI